MASLKIIPVFAIGVFFGAVLLSDKKPSPSPRPVTSLYQIESLPSPTPLDEVKPQVRLETPAPREQTSPKEAAPAKFLYVSGNRVPLRSAPDAKAPILDRLNQGQSVEEISRSGEWVKVRHGLSQVEGYIFKKRLRDTPPEEPEEKPKPKEKKEQIETLTKAAIIALIIERSVSQYRATRPCACPYNTDRGGRSCGARSAYSRPGGAKPLCYAGDVTGEMIKGFRMVNR